MPLPANTTTVVVLGTFNTPEGNPSTGTITFTPSAWLLNSGANIAIPNSAVSKTLGTAGNFSVTLPITDDADLSPNPFIYTVTEVIDGVSQSYNISIPGTVASGGTVYLADLAPVAAAGPEYYSLASSLAIGTVTTLAAGSAATATITGLAPSQTLNLGLPTASLGALTPQALGVAAAGSSGTASREDHVHSSTVANPTFTGQVVTAAGDATTPAIAPTGDTNTGIFYPTADTVGISTGGTERLRVNSSGNVGIGTNSPAGLLHVDGGLGVVQRYANSGAVLIRRANGSAGTPTAVSSGDAVCLVIGRAFDGSSTYRDVGSISFSAAENTTTTASGGYFSIATTAFGATATTERMRVDSNGLITGTGTSLGAWTSYTPTLGGTGWAIGNGTASGFYCQIGKVMFVRVSMTFGNTSTFGAGGLTCSLPANANGNFPASSAGLVRYIDTSASAFYLGAGGIASNVFAFQSVTSATGQVAALVNSAPFTWADTDIIRLSMAYEIA